MWGLTVTSAPATEPIDVTTAKSYLRLEHSEDDTLISTLITAARKYCEEAIGRAFITQTLRLSLDDWPCDGVIRLPRPPLQSVSSITYLDSNGDTQTLSASNYVVDIYSHPGRIVPSYAAGWFPDHRGDYGQLRITYVAGYGNASAVPETLRLACLYLVNHWYEERRAVLATGAVPKEIPLTVVNLLALNSTGEQW